MKEAVIVAGVRTAVGRAPRGALRTTRPDEMAAAMITEVLRRAEGLSPEMVEDVILGCAFPEAEQGLNMGRLVALRAGLPHSVPGQTVNRFCSSGLQAIADASMQIMAGFAKCIIAGGTESMSMVPMTGKSPSMNPWLAEKYPAAYISMGLTAEQVAKEFKVSREEQDALALRSHQRAIAAQDAGKFKDEIVPLQVETVAPAGGGKVQRSVTVFDSDEGPRRDTSLAALASLRPAFAANGTVTAGNSSQTSDGAAAVIVMERGFAEELGLKPLMRFVSFAAAGVRPEVMGIGPTVAVPKALRLAGLSLGDIDLIELNEAFAAQAAFVIRELELDVEKVNVNGGAVALGHPLGCTGAKLTVQIMNELKRRKGRYGLVTMCIGMGMGAAGIFENLN